MEKVIGVDVDGVLADFNQSYRNMLIATSGKDLFKGETDPPCWNYAPAYGYTQEEDTAAWSNITKSYCFWRNLSALKHAGDFLWALAASHLVPVPDKSRVYFITSRPGLDVKGQTERWLHALGVPNPTVLIVGNHFDKGPVASALSLTHFVDDKPENCLAVRATRHNACTVFCPPYRYNTMEHGWLKTKGVVIGGLPEFARACGLTWPASQAA